VRRLTGAEWRLLDDTAGLIAVAEQIRQPDEKHQDERAA
jgi:hypothetical protein